MTTTLLLVQTLIFAILSALHFIWAFGGTWELDLAVPTNIAGKKVLSPTRIESGVVAIGLGLFAVYYLALTDNMDYFPPKWVISYAGWIIPGIFLLRAVGEFRYVGFFKSIRNTAFGRLDTRYYSPLCLIIALIGFFVQYYR